MQNKHILRWCMHFKSHFVIWQRVVYLQAEYVLLFVVEHWEQWVHMHKNVVVSMWHPHCNGMLCWKHYDENAEKLLCIYVISSIMQTWHYYQPTCILVKVAVLSYTENFTSFNTGPHILTYILTLTPTHIKKWESLRRMAYHLGFIKNQNTHQGGGEWSYNTV